jgi:carbamoyl-phosphate synthase large subunit
MYTTLWGAEAAAEGITSGGGLEVYPVQGLHGALAQSP